MRWRDPKGHLVLSVAGRTLAVHDEGAFKDWGVRVGVFWDPHPETKEGFSAAFGYDLGNGSVEGDAPCLDRRFFLVKTRLEVPRAGTLKLLMASAVEGIWLARRMVGSEAPRGRLRKPVWGIGLSRIHRRPRTCVLMSGRTRWLGMKRSMRVPV